MAPPQLPEASSHQAADNFIVADAFQTLQLPNVTGENGEDRIPFSLDSGHWEIAFVINGTAVVRVVNPPPLSVKSLTELLSSSTVTMTQIGSLHSMRTHAGHKHVFSLGPDGVIAQRLPRVSKQTRQWSLIPTNGAQSVAIVARDKNTMDIITVSKGTVRVGSRKLAETADVPVKWKEIGEDMQPSLNTLPLPNGSVLLFGLTCAGEVRTMLLSSAYSHTNHWRALGGSFIGRVAALAIDDGVELFAVTPQGAVQYTKWHANDKSPAHWLNLGEDAVTHISASADIDGNYLFALTPKRQILTMSRERTRWPESWQKKGSLDKVEAETYSHYQPHGENWVLGNNGTEDSLKV
jgi:hypothetical protein